jgi:hypothetical protein
MVKKLEKTVGFFKAWCKSKEETDVLVKEGAQFLVKT